MQFDFTRTVAVGDAKLFVGTIDATNHSSTSSQTDSTSPTEVVLLHGFPESHRQWFEVAEQLCENYRLHLIDTRGCGLSSRPAGGYDLQTLVSDLIAVLDALKIHTPELPTPVHLVGHDIGGMIATAAALSHPDRFATLANFEGPPPGLTYDGWNEIVSQFWHFGMFAQPDLPELLITGRERKFVAWFIRQYGFRIDRLTPEVTNRHADDLARDGGLRAAMSLYRCNHQNETYMGNLTQSTKLPMPVLAGGGQHCLADAVAKLHHPIAENLTPTIIPHAGHWVTEENPDYVTRQLLTHFNRA